MADVNDLYKEAQKDPAMKDRWFNDVKPKFYAGKSDDSARMFFDLALFNNENKYERERRELAEAHIFRYNERKRQIKGLYTGLAGIAVGVAAFFAPVEKHEAVQMASATLGLVSLVVGAHYVSKLRE